MQTIIGLVFLLMSTTVLAATNQNQYIIKLKSGVEKASFLSNKNILNASEMGVSFGNYLKVTINGEQKALLNELKSHPEVAYIEKNQTYTVQPVESGKLISEKEISKFAQQWGLKNTGKNSGPWYAPGKKGEDINAEKAWTLNRGSKDIVVAIIDTGIDWTHQDLKGNLFVNEAEQNGEAGVDDDGNGYVDDIYGYDFANNDGDPKDGHGHGTHCSGVIGATHKRSGVRGVMGKVKIFGVKFLTDRGSGTTENAIKSIDYAIKRGANVLSNSWGGGGFSQALKDAIVAANEAGIVFVAAAGNSNANNDTKDTYPANYAVDNVISVGAMAGTGKRSSFSNYGKTKVHVFAPGSNILSTVTNNGYKKMSGTSMACPHVAGGIGLLLASSPNLTPLEVRERLEATAVRNGLVDKYTTSGRMDVFRLLKNIR